MESHGEALGELTSAASRTDPALVTAASEVRAAIATAATNQAGWATPDQLANRLDLPNTSSRPFTSAWSPVEIAYVVRDSGRPPEPPYSRTSSA